MKIGFLPLYIELYDNVGSATRQMTQPFYDRLADAFCEKEMIFAAWLTNLKPQLKNLKLRK